MGQIKSSFFPQGCKTNLKPKSSPGSGTKEIKEEYIQIIKIAQLKERKKMSTILVDFCLLDPGGPNDTDPYHMTL